jgi:hypothetical protein
MQAIARAIEGYNRTAKAVLQWISQLRGFASIAGVRWCMEGRGRGLENEGGDLGSGIDDWGRTDSTQ